MRFFPNSFYFYFFPNRYYYLPKRDVNLFPNRAKFDYKMTISLSIWVALSHKNTKPSLSLFLSLCFCSVLSLLHFDLKKQKHWLAQVYERGEALIGWKVKICCSFLLKGKGEKKQIVELCFCSVQLSFHVIIALFQLYTPLISTTLLTIPKTHIR